MLRDYISSNYDKELSLTGKRGITKSAPKTLKMISVIGKASQNYRLGKEILHYVGLQNFKNTVSIRSGRSPLKQ
jgi:hypothetical protein